MSEILNYLEKEGKNTALAADIYKEVKSSMKDYSEKEFLQDVQKLLNEGLLEKVLTPKPNSKEVIQEKREKGVNSPALVLMELRLSEEMLGNWGKIENLQKEAKGLLEKSEDLV